MKEKYSTILIWIIILFVLLLFSIGSYGQVNRNRIPDWIDFYKETLTFRCQLEKVEVSGEYYFKNLTSSTLSFTVMFPFPVDEYHPFPDSILVKNYSFQRKGKNIFWIMTLEPHEKVKFGVFYVQKSYDRQFEYILNTVKEFWKRPITEFNTKIIFPKDWRTLKINYRYDAESIKNSEIILYMERRNFFPKENIKISW